MAQLKRGHALLDGKLLRLMGNKATASAGAVVAHHQAPLASVLRELRKSEKRAKTEGGRDAFSITLRKRSGGAVQLTLPWLTPGDSWPTALEGSLTDTPMALLLKLRNIFSGDTSRKAAYLTQGWLTGLPTAAQIGMPSLQAMIAANLEYQLKRQGGKDDAQANAAAARLLVDIACRIAEQRKNEPAPIIRDLLGIAEFLARESRTGEMA